MRAAPAPVRRAVPCAGCAGPRSASRSSCWPRAAGWWLYKKLDGNITTDNGTAAELKKYEKERPGAPAVHDAQNILLIGSDTRGGGNGKYGAGQRHPALGHHDPAASGGRPAERDRRVASRAT